MAAAPHHQLLLLFCPIPYLHNFHVFLQVACLGGCIVTLFALYMACCTTAPTTATIAIIILSHSVWHNFHVSRCCIVTLFAMWGSRGSSVCQFQQTVHNKIRLPPKKLPPKVHEGLSVHPSVQDGFLKLFNLPLLARNNRGCSKGSKSNSSFVITNPIFNQPTAKGPGSSTTSLSRHLAYKDISFEFKPIFTTHRKSLQTFMHTTPIGYSQWSIDQRNPQTLNKSKSQS